MSFFFFLTWYDARAMYQASEVGMHVCITSRAYIFAIYRRVCTHVHASKVKS